MFGLLNLSWLKFGIPVGLVVLAGIFANSFAKEYRNMASEIAAYQRTVATLTSRNDAYHRMIERRNEAINASKCKSQITNWIKNPSSMPSTFNPLEQQN